MGGRDGMDWSWWDRGGGERMGREGWEDGRILCTYIHTNVTAMEGKRLERLETRGERRGEGGVSVYLNISKNQSRTTHCCQRGRWWWCTCVCLQSVHLALPIRSLGLVYTIFKPNNNQSPVSLIATPSSRVPLAALYLALRMLLVLFILQSF